MDLHLHTPGSADYQEPEASYLDILKQAESRNLDMIAFTDHNTVAGYRAMMEEIEQLEWLKKMGRTQEQEEEQLSEYHRLLEKILVLPGFEFTATFGFHILGIFSTETNLRELEHILLTLNIPAEVLDEGETNVGATTDVLTAYQVINEHGGIVIAAHANSNHGVAMRGLDFAGQTRIAYTQDPNLHSLEVTDLERRGRYTTARFFDGSKPEYPRPMRCIQGSDAHLLTTDPKNKKHLGIGERSTEVLLPKKTFEALFEMFQGNDFARTRPARVTSFDFIQQVREEGPGIVQSFHESMTRRGGRLYAIIADACAFANTNGGTIYVGVHPENPKAKPVGVSNTSESIDMLRSEIERTITPPLDVQIDVQETLGKSVIRIRVPKGSEPPYAIDDNKIYVRDEAETSLAVRDEIVQLVLSAHQSGEATSKQAESEPRFSSDGVEPPRTGVEIVSTQSRQGTSYHTMRDLRNGNEVRNVTRQSARRLWHYAIIEKEEHPIDPNKVDWKGDIAIWKKQKRGGSIRYDLVQRTSDGIRVYYGVTENGISGPWQTLIDEE